MTATLPATIVVSVRQVHPKGTRHGTRQWPFPLKQYNRPSAIGGRTMEDTPEQLLSELRAVPQAERLQYLAGQPRNRLVLFKRILPREDPAKLERYLRANEEIDAARNRVETFRGVAVWLQTLATW
ncbi:MAG: hypothetical protein IPJ41_12000 [Phycisphaerales bacterium]|nr:hypothetical protein [Phycisphaerales bacterium]